jgi:UDP-N-acetylmuramoylalanine--D-glutamate ligase
MLDVKGKRVVVVGLGASGIAACELLVARGAKVVGTDSKTDIRPIAGVEIVLGGHAGADLGRADLIVVSPGVPSFPELLAARCPIWGEIELATRALEHPAPLVAVGGTNGKSTVTTLVGLFLEKNDMKVFTGGNLGEPLASHAHESFDAIVLEVSSFQMERVDEFHPRVSVLLNVTPDHLDRYPSFDAYAQAKGNAFLRQTPDDVAVIPVDDEMCKMQASRGRGRIVTFGEGGQVEPPPPHAMLLKGAHNAMNAAAAIAAVRPFGVADEEIDAVLQSFTGLAHRMALVAETQGVRYYDDSKGTNVGASVTAIRGIAEKKVVLIAGGRDKGGSYGPLVDALRDRGRAAVLIGEASDAIEKAIAGALPVKRATSMEEAVKTAQRLAQPGDAVLLSPACSSFDMFKDYKHRGDAFALAVKALA